MSALPANHVVHRSCNSSLRRGGPGARRRRHRSGSVRCTAETPSSEAFEADQSGTDPLESTTESTKPIEYADSVQMPDLDYKLNVILRALSADDEVAVLAINGTQLVREAQKLHGLSPTATAALGRALLGGVLMSSFRKEDESLQMTFFGDGPLGSVQVIAESRGVVKGKVGNPLVDLPVREDGKLDVGGAVGNGSLAVVRTQPLSPVPYTGTVELISGEIAEDLTHYLATSEQTNSALALGVQIGPDGVVSAAGGYLIQVLPFASDETLEKLEGNIQMMPNVSDLLAMGMGLEQLLERLLEGVGVNEESRGFVNPQYGPCDKEGLETRMKRAVAALGEPEIDRIMEEEGKIEVHCHFCNATYEFDDGEVRALLREGGDGEAAADAASTETGSIA